MNYKTVNGIYTNKAFLVTQYSMYINGFYSVICYLEGEVSGSLI